MELNTQVWGEIANGHNADWNEDTTETGYQLTVGQYYNLSGYLTQNRISYDSPIDDSIAYAGAYELAMGDVGYIYNANDFGTAADENRMVEFYGEMPFTFGTYSLVSKHGDSGTYAQRQNSKSHAFLNFLGDTALENNSGYYWLHGGNGNGVDNINRLICPFIDFGLRAIYYGIYCNIIDTNNNSSWHWLSELSSYPNYKIERVVMWPYVRHGHGSGWSTYNNAPYEDGGDLLLPIPLKPVNANGADYMNYYEFLSQDGVITLYGIIGGLWSHGYSDGHFYSSINIPTKKKCNAGMPWNYTYNGGFTFIGWNWCKNHASPTISVYGGGDDADTATLEIKDYVLNNTEENREYIRRAAASFGVFFTDGNAYDLLNNNSRWTDTSMCLGLLENGVGKGLYTRGTGNTDNPAYTWDSSHDSDYTPTSDDDDPNTYSDTTNWNTLTLQTAFTRRYALSASDVNALAGKLWDANATKDPDMSMNEFTLDEYLTNNPIDCIVSLKYFPCSFITDSVLPLTPLYLGKYDTTMLVYGVDKSVKIIDFDPIKVYRHFHDFRDFEPYTKLSMYIPFCGTISIPTAECMDKWVSVRLAIDVSTGACTGFILCNSVNAVGGICIATATGTAAIDIPVSGIQSANLANAIFNATANWTQTQISNAKIQSGLINTLFGSDSTAATIARGFNKSVGGIGAGITSGGLSGAVSTAFSLNPINNMYSGMLQEMEVKKADYQLTHIDLPMRMIGNASPTLASVIESDCRLIINRPITDNTALASYAGTVGYACLMSGIVSDFNGFTVGTIDLSGINATADEKRAIAAAFANGVYL